MITREEAKIKIQDIVDHQTPIKTGITLPIRKGEKFDVYRIPLDLLVPNILNDRITWRIREYEAENSRKLSVDSDVDVDFIYATILEEHKQENEKTKADLARNGQQVDGVITNEGIIIDGNRRATLLRELFKGEASKYNKSVEDFRYFNAIVLPGSIDEKEIMALETMIQIGSDEKVGYNRICLYIKVDNLLAAGYNHDQIKEYMGLKTAGEVDSMKETFKLMTDYLEAIGKPNHFSLLDGLEDQFLNTKTIFKKMDNGTYDAQWDYQPSDVADFKMICYDYMRAKFEGKKYRDVLVGKPNKTDGVFIEKSVWDKFLKRHNDILDSNDPETEADWKLLGKKGGKLEQNLTGAVNDLKSVLNDKDVAKLISDLKVKVDRVEELLDAMEEVNTDDINDLRELSKTLYKIASKFE